VIYSAEGGQTYRSVVDRIEVNVPLDASKFYAREEPAPTRQKPSVESASEEDRLKKIIDTFEKKYQ
jgi:hypothetical protein